MKALLDDIRKQGAKVYDGEAAIALRAIEQGARTLHGPHESDAAYLELARRLLQVDAAEATQQAAASSGSLILP
jgi:hypothetical protein